MGKTAKINFVCTKIDHPEQLIKKGLFYYLDKYEQFDQKALLYLNGFTTHLPQSIVWLFKGKFKEKIKQKQLEEQLEQLEEKIFPLYLGISK